MKKTEDAIEAISMVLDDQSVSRETIKTRLEMLLREIEACVDAVDFDIAVADLRATQKE